MTEPIGLEALQAELGPRATTHQAVEQVAGQMTRDMLIPDAVYDLDEARWLRWAWSSDVATIARRAR